MRRDLLLCTRRTSDRCSDTARARPMSSYRCGCDTRIIAVTIADPGAERAARTPEQVGAHPLRCSDPRQLYAAIRALYEPDLVVVLIRMQVTSCAARGSTHRRANPSQPGVLDDIFRVRDLAEHPVRHPDQDPTVATNSAARSASCRAVHRLARARAQARPRPGFGFVVTQ